MAKIAMPASEQAIKFTQKKLALLSYISHILASTPDSLLPMEVARNQPPIISEVNRGGATLETSDKPMGDRKSSPTVITPYDAMSHQAEDFSCSRSVLYTARAIIEVDRAVMRSPYPILAGVDGSAFLLLSQPNKPTTSGVSRMIKKGLTD